MGQRPGDFDQFWQRTLDTLAGYPACPEIDAIPLRSTDFATLYGVRLTSLGPYRLFGYLSVPAGDGPFPAIYYAPKYQSVLEIIPQGTANLQRSRYITFSLAARGDQRLSARLSVACRGPAPDAGLLRARRVCAARRRDHPGHGGGARRLAGRGGPRARGGGPARSGDGARVGAIQLRRRPVPGTVDSGAARHRGRGEHPAGGLAPVKLGTSLRFLF